MRTLLVAFLVGCGTRAVSSSHSTYTPSSSPPPSAAEEHEWVEATPEPEEFELGPDPARLARHIRTAESSRVACLDRWDAWIAWADYVQYVGSFSEMYKAWVEVGTVANHIQSRQGTPTEFGFAADYAATWAEWGPRFDAAADEGRKQLDHIARAGQPIIDCISDDRNHHMLADERAEEATDRVEEMRKHFNELVTNHSGALATYRQFHERYEAHRQSR